MSTADVAIRIFIAIMISFAVGFMVGMRNGMALCKLNHKDKS